MPNIYAQLDIPENRRKTSITAEQGEFILNFLRARPISGTLETGFAYGCSAAYILSATNAPHIAIDAYEEGYGNVGLLNIVKLGLQPRFQLIKLPSHVALPQLLMNGTAVDFAFIDGGHKFEEIFIDWFYISLLLNRNGYVLFDDSWLEATQMVASFLRNNRKDYREIDIPVPNMYLFQKIGNDSSEWTNFRSFSIDN